MATITIEVKNPRNMALHFKPTGERVRGALDFVSTRDKDLYAYGQTFDGQTIPGKRIVLDTAARTGLVFDPLKLPENAALFEKLAAVNADPIRNGATIKPGDEKRYADLSQDEVATWLNEMRKAVRAGLAVVVSGDISAKVEGTPRTEFLHKREKVADKRDETIAQLAALVQQQSEQIAKLLAAKK